MLFHLGREWGIRFGRSPSELWILAIRLDAGIKGGLPKASNRCGGNGGFGGDAPTDLADRWS